MSTTLAILRQEMSEAQGDFFSGTTTGAGSSTTLVDTGLVNLPNGGDEDFCEGWYVKITDSCNCADGEVRRVTSYDNCTNTITVGVAFSASTGSGTDYELHRFDPDDKDSAINRAISRIYPALYRHVIDETLVVDNWLLNNSFETTGTSPKFTNWTESGSPTVTAETTIVRHGTNSAKVVSDACNDGQLQQAPHMSVKEITGKEVTAKFWVYATSGSVARIRIDDGAGTESSDFHSGADQWEFLSVTKTIDDSATQVQVELEVASGGNTAYFDAGYLIVVSRPVDRYDIPSDIIDGPHFVSEQVDEGDPAGLYHKIIGPPQSGNRIRIEGMGVLSSMSADSDTTEVDEPRVELVVAGALYWFNRMLAQRSSTQDRSRYLQDAEFWRGEMDQLSIRHNMPAMAAEVSPRGMFAPQWHTEGNPGSKILVFDRERETVQGLGFSRNFRR